MSLVKCPDCEKMVSQRADKCPFCGCPAKFFIYEDSLQSSNKEKAHVNETNMLKGNDTNQIEERADKTEIASNQGLVDAKINFYFGKYGVAFHAKGAAFAAFFGTYLQAADMAYERMLDCYRKAGSIRKALEILPDKANAVIFSLIDKGTGYLYSQGVYITQEEFFRKYNCIYTMDYDRYYSVTLEKYSQILDMQKEMAAYRDAVKARRGRWQGGGFGIKGAIKGAMTASALNMGSKFLHSFGDASRERKDNEAVQQKLRVLYNESKGQLCHSVKTCMMNVYRAMCEELKKINAFEEIILLQPDKAEALFENTQKYETDADTIKCNMIKCIALYPGERKYYEVFFDDFMNEETDIRDFLQFWHLEYLLSDILDSREKQDEFTAFMEKKGIGGFDFGNLTAENAIVLWSWLDEYGKDVPKNGECAECVSRYLHQFRDKWEEHKKEILVDYHPAKFKFREFHLSCVKNQKWLDVKSLSAFSFYVTSENNRIRDFLESDGDYVQLYYDTSMTEMGTSGLAVTGRYVVDLKSRNRIKISDIRKVEVETAGEYRFELLISDEEKEIRFCCSEIKDNESAAYYLKNYLKAVFVRYRNNRFLTVTRVIHLEETAIPEVFIDKKSAEEYLGYVKKYQKDTGKPINLQFSNMFRRRFKSIWSSQWKKIGLEERNIINQYDYKLSDNSILRRTGGEAYGQYILISTEVFTLTDFNMYINGKKYDLAEIREILLFANMHIEDNRYI